ncbi:hypothetical protein TALC_01135 [Thermoplasmatales archaeon BRNA1]|nr:hypothetical protein TALC_01135 [Thermoplasmatales archaeon BRNA1]
MIYMDPSQTKIIAIVCVAVLAVGAGAAVFLYMGSDGSDPDYGAALPVYGNADLDADIDSDDLDVIQKIIDQKEGYTLAKYGLADANRDGKVTADDKTLVQNIIDKKEVTIFHNSYANDGGDKVTISVVSSKWPATNVMTTYNSTEFIFKVIGASANVVAGTDAKSTGQDLALYWDIYANASALATTDWGMNIDLDNLSTVMEAKKTRTLFASGYSAYDATNVDGIEALGCDVIRLCESVPLLEPTVASILLAGFFVDKLDNAKDVAELYTKVYNKTMTLAGKIADADKVKFMCGLGGENNQHTVKCVKAGGAFALTGATDAVIDMYGSYEVGDWIYKYKVDCFLEPVWSNANNGHFFDKTLNKANILKIFGDDPDIDGWGTHGLNIENMQVYKDGHVYVVYGDLPMSFDILLRGYTMYPDVYKSLYNDSMEELLEHLGKNKDGKEFSSLGLKFVYSIEEIKALP